MKGRTYRVLAADDEYWSRENLRSLISWEEYSLEFLEPACDGEEVLERIPEEKPDIILTDIDMPFLSGLELLERLQTDHKDIITVAISGYDDFEKVKGVFITGGIDYLLKPVGKEELINVLTKVLGILEEREAKEAESESNRLKQRKISSFLDDSEYSALLSNKLYGNTSSQVHVSSTRTYSEVVTMLVKFYDISQIAARYQYDVLSLSWSIKSKLRELYKKSNTIIFNNRNKMSEFLIIGTTDEKDQFCCANQILKEFPEEEYGPVSVVIHGQTSSLDDIGLVYREIIAVLVTRPFQRTHCILRCPERSRMGAVFAIEKSIPLQMEEELYHLLLTGQKAGAADLIFKTADFMHCSENGWTFFEVKQYMGRINSVLFRYVRRQIPAMLPQVEELLDNVDYYMKCLDAKTMLTTINILLDSLWENNEQKDTETAVSQVEYIYRYITENFHENITLASLAQDYHMDASYLSRSFRRKYGETIIAFLTRMRIEQAERLMQDPDKKLETISFLVGYDDYNYFSRVFRKKKGISPSEYRAKYLQSQI